jgi:hypothetical protein
VGDRLLWAVLFFKIQKFWSTFFLSIHYVDYVDILTKKCCLLHFGRAVEGSISRACGNTCVALPYKAMPIMLILYPNIVGTC